jgi:hypothetical protein
MQPPAEDLERRRPVWEALAAVFLDTEIDDEWRAEIVATLCASGYSTAELERILWDELCPVLHNNLLSVAGEWDGFDMGVVAERILTRPTGWRRRWLAYIAGGRLARHEWQRIREAMEAVRACSPDAAADRAGG